MTLHRVEQLDRRKIRDRDEERECVFEKREMGDDLASEGCNFREL